jgi:antibiotic biosynthesis monooxygenase (ABM) superfamily enzyme
MPDTPAPPAGHSAAHPVTVAITRRVRPQDELLMQAWVHAGTSMAERFPGFLGTGWVRPAADSTDWHMLYRFDSPESLRRWEESTERTRWLRSAQDLVEHTRVEHRTGIEGWFDEPRERSVSDLTVPTPPRWKQAVVIWVAFFPTNLLFTWLLTPLLGHWPLGLRVLVSTLLLTPVMTYLVLPRVTRLLQPWLTGRRARAGVRTGG